MSAENVAAPADNPFNRRVILILVGTSIFLGAAFGVYTYIEGKKRESARVAASEAARLTAERESAQPSEVDFSSSTEVVSMEQIEKMPFAKTEVVEADFNVDGLVDAAIVQTFQEGKREVGVYIQQNSDPVKPAKGKTYRKAGTIREIVGSRIMGIASSKRSGLINLIILVGGSGQENEMIEYRNDGKRFVRVDQKKVKAADAAP